MMSPSGPSPHCGPTGSDRLIQYKSEREIALIKVHAPRSVRTELIAIVGIYNARVVDVGASTMILEITAFPSKVEQFIEIMRPFGIKELLRTGRIAMVRGAQSPRNDAVERAEVELAVV